MKSVLPLIHSGLYTDLYQLAMSQAYYQEDRHTVSACFDYYFRKIPFGGGYVVFSGLETLLEALESFQFRQEDLNYLQSIGFKDSFLRFLKTFRFCGNIYSCHEGEIVFPYAPIMRVEGTILESQLIETLLLNLVNFESLIATKAARIKHVAQNRAVSEFGFRRAHALAAVLASRASIVGGATTTSNVLAGHLFGVKVSGTMAHSFIQSFDSELDAFRAFAQSNPDNCVFLVDSYNTLGSGVPNAIKVALEMKERGQTAIGIRLDSGDLAYLAKSCRKMLDEANLNDMKIVASNQLDEWVIKSLIDQGAPIDVFGVGTRLATGAPDAALDGVYKLALSNKKPRIKLSENIKKLTLPGRKQVFRTFQHDGMFEGADVIALTDEPHEPERMIHPFEPGKSFFIQRLQKEPLLRPVFKNGQRLTPPKSLTEIATYTKKRLQLLPPAYKRFEYPHIYKIGLSPSLFQLREKLRHENKGSIH